MTEPLIKEAHNLLILSTELLSSVNNMMVDILVHENVTREELKARYDRIDALQDKVYEYIISVADVENQIAISHDTHITMH